MEHGGAWSRRGGDGTLGAALFDGRGPSRALRPGIRGPDGQGLTAHQKRFLAAELQDHGNFFLGQGELVGLPAHLPRPDGQPRTRAPRIILERTKSRFSPDKSDRALCAGAWSRTCAASSDGPRLRDDNECLGWNVQPAKQAPELYNNVPRCNGTRKHSRDRLVVACVVIEHPRREADR